MAGCRRVMGINILRQHVQAVFRVAMSITRRKEVAEDLTSEAFLALHRETASIDPSQLPAWLRRLYAIAPETCGVCLANTPAAVRITRHACASRRSTCTTSHGFDADLD